LSLPIVHKDETILNLGEFLKEPWHKDARPVENSLFVRYTAWKITFPQKEPHLLTIHKQFFECLEGFMWFNRTAMISQLYARCQVWPGTFDSELYVILGEVSAIVDKRNVKMDSPANGAEVPGSVLVYLIEESPDRALVELPGQPVVGGLRTWVSKEFLAAA
jgi:hypothetical protein